MKINIICILAGLVLFLCPVCFASSAPTYTNRPMSPNKFERLVESPESPYSKAKSLSKSPESPETGGIYNVTAGPVIDNDLDRFCVSYNNNVKIEVPDEGLNFYLDYYHREKNPDGTWGEWVKDFTGAIWYFTPEDAQKGYLEFYHHLREENGTIPPSRWEFMVEMHDPEDGYLLGKFVVNRYRYWYPLVESELYDSRDSNQKEE